MNPDLLNKLSPITEEEARILEGRQDIDRSLYYRADPAMQKKDEVDASVVLANGKQIDMRPHTRFIHFPWVHYLILPVHFLFNLSFLFEPYPFISFPSKSSKETMMLRIRRTAPNKEMKSF